MENIPRFFKIRQLVSAPRLQDPPRHLREQFSTLGHLLSGRKTIALALGSRGISGIVPMVKTLIQELQDAGIRPFIAAAMGSHGNGTAEGQLEVLHGYGLTEQALGVAVLASEDVVEVPGTSPGDPVYISRIAWEADGIIPVNRIKKHTDIHGEIESGIAKMIAIGLGNKYQAEKLHYGGIEYLSRRIPEICEEVCRTGKIPFALGIVENAYAETAVAELIPADRMIAREKELLAYYKQISPRLPVDDLDVLIIDRGGKDVSGSCIETHIIGRMLLHGEKELTSPKIKRIVLTDLTDHACGNAGGMGLADFITRRFFNKIDFKSTYTNCISCFYSERGMIPLIMETDRDAVEAAMKTSRNMDTSQPRMMRICDTLHLEYLYVTEPVCRELENKPGIEILSGPVGMFSPEGELLPF